MKHKVGVKEFYKFFVTNEALPDSKLADKIVFKYAGITHVLALDLIASTRQARKVSDNLVERIKK